MEPALTVTNNLRSASRRPSQAEKGAILVLVAVLLVVIFSFAALAVDLTAAASDAQLSRQYVKLAALAALEEYNDTTGSHAERMAAALERVNQISQLNVTLGVDGETADSNLIEERDDAEAVLKAGRWFYAKPEQADPCSGDYPCFVAGASDTDLPNAFQISGRLHNAYRPIFGRLLWGPDKSVDILVSATASVVPRHACFLIDLSPSMVRETHQIGGQGSEFAFLLESDNPGIGAERHDTDWQKLSTEFPTRESAQTVHNEHYADDYEERATLSDINFYAKEDNYGNSIDYGKYHYDPSVDAQYAVNAGHVYRIDTFRDETFRGPEPLRTVFEGLERAIDIFETRAVAGDKVCLIFYDHSLSWTRIVNLTDDFDYLRSFVSWDRLDDPTYGFEKAIQHGLFPSRSGKTDMTQAVAEAMKQFVSAQSADVPSSDFMVLIGDGLTNCRSCPGLIPGMDQTDDGEINNDDLYKIHICSDDGFLCSAFCHENQQLRSICASALGEIPFQCPPPAALCEGADIDNNGRVDTGDVEAWSEAYKAANGCFKPGCTNSVENYWYSMQELKQYVERQVYPTLTPIHVILVGDKAAPHTVDVNDPDYPQKCLSDNQARSQDIPLVKGLVDTWSCNSGCTGQYRDTNGTLKTVSDLELRTAWHTNFYQVNRDMYDIAVMTGGIWGPIRPQGAGCSPSDTPVVCGSNQGTIDGRRMEDPYCRTTGQQIRDYMIKIIGQNPYTIVDHR